jgi:dipeptidyl aminopeptidase/acylaminoacyl peptidase
MTRDTRLDPGFDARIADWLEADPDTAPRQVLDTVLAAVPSISQRRPSWLPWRTQPMNRLLLAGAAIAALFAVGVFGMQLTSNPGPLVGSSPSPGSSASSGAPPSPSGISGHTGLILFEHLGNAPDGTEMDFEEVNPDKRRFYLADPNNLNASGFTEFLPGQPASGKTSADVSRDGTKVVFQDFADPSRLYEANLDGSGFRALTPEGCGCSEWDAAYDPAGTRIAYGRSEGDEAWLEIRDLATGETTRLEATVGPSADAVPEAPSWSPDGARIVFARTTWGGVEPFMGRIHYGDPAASARLQIVDVAADVVTELPTGNAAAPGDPDWSPDGTLIAFTEHPMTIGGGSGESHRLYTVKPDGTDRTLVAQVNGATWTPDGRLLYAYNRFYLVGPDGSQNELVDPAGMDNTETPIGFVYIGHWIDAQ